MGRNPKATFNYIKMAQKLRKSGTIAATNIIVDYQAEDGSFYQNFNPLFLESHFDYWVLNPHWDGVWDRAKAEQRFKTYIENEWY
jgi:hypothetical protein